MTNKDDWTKSALSSLEGISKATPDNELLINIMQQIQKDSTLSKWQIQGTAVAAILLITVNVYALRPSETIVHYEQPTVNNVSLVSDFSIY